MDYLNLAGNPASPGFTLPCDDPRPEALVAPWVNARLIGENESRSARRYPSAGLAANEMPSGRCPGMLAIGCLRSVRPRRASQPATFRRFANIPASCAGAEDRSDPAPVPMSQASPKPGPSGSEGCRSRMLAPLREARQPHATSSAATGGLVSRHSVENCAKYGSLKLKMPVRNGH